MTRTRYVFEHRLLPQEFFNRSAPFLTLLDGGGQRLWDSLRICYLLAGEDCPYQADDFDVTPLPASKGQLLIRLDFPAPEEVTDCYWAYLFIDRSTGHQSYFTVEKSLDQLIVLGEWQSDQHLNHGNVSLDEEAIRQLCQKLFDQALSDLDP